jgi:hypothetical protein
MYLKMLTVVSSTPFPCGILGQLTSVTLALSPSSLFSKLGLIAANSFTGHVGALME